MVLKFLVCRAWASLREVISAQRGVIDQGQGEGHHIAGRGNQRDHQRVLHGVVPDIGRTGPPDGNGLIRIAGLDSHDVAVRDGKSRPVSALFRAMERGPGVSVGLVGGLQREAQVGILPVIPVVGHGGDVPGHVVSRRAAGELLLVHENGIRRGGAVLRLRPCQVFHCSAVARRSGTPPCSAGRRQPPAAYCPIHRHGHSGRGKIPHDKSHSPWAAKSYPGP